MRRQPTMVLMFCLLLFGCAATPSLRPIRSGETVSIAVVASPDYPERVDIRNTAVADGLSAGIGSGAVVGGLWGLSCGPFAALCVPLGAVTGMVTGGAAAAAVGATGILSSEKANLVKDRLLRIEQTHPLPVELKRNLDARAQKYWTVSSEATAALVTVELQELEVATTRDERLRFVLRVKVTQGGNAATQVDRSLQKTYEYISPFSSLAIWMDEQSDLLDISLSSACQQIAAQVVADLALR